MDATLKDVTKKKRPELTAEEKLAVRSRVIFPRSRIRGGHLKADQPASRYLPSS